MSKLTKFINNPNLFFRDMFDKKLGYIPNKKVNSIVKSTVRTAVKPIMKPALMVNNDIDISNFNSFIKYDFIYHCGESLEAGAHHLRSWLPILISSNLKFVLIVRNRKIYDWAIKNFPYLSIVFGRRAVDIETILHHIHDIQLALYSSAGINNGHLIRFNHIRHVFIGHGDSEKAGSAHKGLRWFDEIWTAGQAHIDRFSNIGANFSNLTFRKIGRPALLEHIKASKKSWNERMDGVRVLYLPTWEGVFQSHNYSSISLSREMISGFLKNEQFSISAKFHPYTGGREKAYGNIESKLSGAINNIRLNMIEKDVNLLSVISGYNAFICDISSVVSECLALNCPIFLYIPEGRNIEMAESNMKYSDYCYVFSDVDQLLSLAERVLINKDDYLSDKRLSALNYFIGYEETERQELFLCLKEFS